MVRETGLEPACPKRTLEPESSASANSAIPASWWAGVDSNHRSQRRQIYSLLPLATREPTHEKALTDHLPEWSWRRDLNPQPADYKSAALPIELRQPTNGWLPQPFSSLSAQRRCVGNKIYYTRIEIFVKGFFCDFPCFFVI